MVMLYGLDDPKPAVLIGTLDHPEEWPPNGRHHGIESQIPWNVIHDDLPRMRTEDDPDVVAAQAAVDQAED
jgi:hypothetical protein